MRINDSIYQVRGGIYHVGDYMNLNRKILVVTDEGVPDGYSNVVLKQCEKGYLYRIPQGEKSKSFSVLQEILQELAKLQFSRQDGIIGIGGGVVGDIAGFAASIYMRGIEYYNIPTTVLAQVDSSVGGKTAINMGGIKNLIGSYYQPRAVLMDADTLQTLPERQVINGLVEALKMGMILDKGLVECMEGADYQEHLETIIKRAVELKCQIVEQDEREAGLRRILNYGHTIGHGFESACMGELLHGEAVACGMLAMSEGVVRERLYGIIKQWGLLESLRERLGKLDDAKITQINQAILHDKKMGATHCKVIQVPEIGKYQIREMTIEEIWKKVGDFSL